MHTSATQATPGPHDIETFTGQYVNVVEPMGSVILLEDIAHHLSMLCRFSGAVRRFYSIAEHAVLVSEILEDAGADRETCLAGLHHDDAEAYLIDVPRPWKSLIRDIYEPLTERMDEAIEASLGLPRLHGPVIKAADNAALLLEASYLLPSRGINWVAAEHDDWGLEGAIQISDPARRWRGGVDPTTAEGLFLSRHHALT